MMGSIRVLFADDDAMYCSLLHRFLSMQSDIEVVGRATDGKEAVRLYEELTPDVVVMDLAMPVMDGLASTRSITAADPEAKVVVLTVHVGEENRKKSIEAGAIAYVSKGDAVSELASAIRGAATAGTSVQTE